MRKRYLSMPFQFSAQYYRQEFTAAVANMQIDEMRDQLAAHTAILPSIYNALPTPLRRQVVAAPLGARVEAATVGVAQAAVVHLPFLQAMGAQCLPPLASSVQGTDTSGIAVLAPPSKTVEPSTSRCRAPTFLWFEEGKHYAVPGTQKVLPPAASTSRRSMPTPALSVVPTSTMHSAGPAVVSRPSESPGDTSNFLATLASQTQSQIHTEILNRITTPYNADALDFFLQKHNLVEAHPNVTQKLRCGFQMGDFPPLRETVIFKNHLSAASHGPFIDSYLLDEVAARRMSGPFTQADTETILQGFFQCSPIIIDVQLQGPGEPDKLRLCRHLSKGDKIHPSTNHFVDKEKFPTRFGTAAEVSEIVSLSLFLRPTCSTRRTSCLVGDPPGRHLALSRDPYVLPDSPFFDDGGGVAPCPHRPCELPAEALVTHGLRPVPISRVLLSFPWVGGCPHPRTLCGPLGSSFFTGQWASVPPHLCADLGLSAYGWVHASMLPRAGLAYLRRGSFGSSPRLPELRATRLRRPPGLPTRSGLRVFTSA
jgi:hypothetical protein